MKNLAPFTGDRLRPLPPPLRENLASQLEVDWEAHHRKFSWGAIAEQHEVMMHELDTARPRVEEGGRPRDSEARRKE